jgi:hypothetical protein
LKWWFVEEFKLTDSKKRRKRIQSTMAKRGKMRDRRNDASCRRSVWSQGRRLEEGKEDVELSLQAMEGKNAKYRTSTI